MLSVFFVSFSVLKNNPYQKSLFYFDSDALLISKQNEKRRPTYCFVCFFFVFSVSFTSSSPSYSNFSFEIHLVFVFSFHLQDESSPAPTPTRKPRLSRAEKARLESEELLKSLGVSIDSGRQTRSSRRGTSSSRVESPKPEPKPTPKRKAATNSTPRRGKKAKVDDQSAENDQTDGQNHVEEQADEAQVA